MITGLKTAVFGAVTSFGLAFAPAALAADSLEIRDFIGSINWSNGPMSIEVQGNKGDLKITEGNRVTVDGQIGKIDSSACKSTYGRYNFDLFGKKKDGRFGGYENLKDYPVLNITLPADIELVIRNSVVFADGAPDVAQADIAVSHCGSIKLGDVEKSLILESLGSADVTVGNTGWIESNMRGSGDLSGGNSGAVILKSQGSGDVELGSIQSLEVKVHGSGDVETLEISGNAEISSHGSGDIELGAIDGILIYSGHGSGDLEVSSVSGSRLSLKSHGSGDIDIDGGDVDSLTISVNGSATVDYAGDAQTANLSSKGSGDIRVDRVRGSAEIRTSGSGDVDIDDRG